MLPALISAGASLLGGFMQNKAQKRQEDMQREFAQSGIQWKVKDAEKAGIHPLYALGAQTTSFQPTAVGDMGIAEAGQNIGRAINATRSTPEQTAALKLTAAQIDGVNLDNELKKTQLASAVRLANQTQQPPGVPSISDYFAIPGQGDGTVVSSVPPGHEARLPQYTNPDLMLEGYRWERAPGTTDAQSWEDVYGDESILPFFINNYKGLRDTWYNTSKIYNRNIVDKLRR